MKDEKRRDAAQYAILAGAEVAKIWAVDVAPALDSLGTISRTLPAPDAPEKSWDAHFALVDGQTDRAMSGIAAIRALKLKVTLRTFTYTVGDFYEMIDMQASGQDGGCAAGRLQEKNVIDQAIQALAAVGFHWGLGVLNPGSEI